LTATGLINYKLNGPKNNYLPRRLLSQFSKLPNQDRYQSANGAKRIAKRFLLPINVTTALPRRLWPADESQPEFLSPSYYDYTVRPGQEQEFYDAVTTVGAPVRDKLMADGVVLAWAIETPVLRLSRRHHDLIWFSWQTGPALKKFLAPWEATLQKMAAEDAKRIDQRIASQAASRHDHG